MGDTSPQLSEVPFLGNIENGDFPGAAGYEGNIALILEENPSSVPNFVSVVTHFRSMLDSSWVMVVLTRRDWTVPSSLVFRRYLISGAIKVRFLPPEFDHFPDHASVSLFLTSPWLWETFETVNRLLMFQPDSILCSKANVSVDDFLEWDFIGAPMHPASINSRTGNDTHEPHPDAQGFNGGLSIRNPRLFRDIARMYDFTADLHSGPPYDELASFMRLEDHWFMRKLEDTPELMDEARLPSPNIAGRFSVEDWFWEQPLGYHQPHRWQSDRYDEIVGWCPEVGMIYYMEGPDLRWGD